MSPAASLHRLPVELLEMIIENLSLNISLKRLSLVNRQFRALSIPYLFQRLKVSFSKRGFKRLEDASTSSISGYVRTISYEAPELVDPYVESWDYFRTCVYTPVEYIRDLRDMSWTKTGKRVSYKSIFFYFSRLCHEQQEILAEGDDESVTRRSLSRLRGLQQVELVFVDDTKKPFSWLAGRVFVDWRDSFPLHLETVLDAMVAARDGGVLLKSFKISGLYSEVATGMRQKVEHALGDVEDIHIFDSPALLDFMTTVSLPSLRRLELGACWIWPEDLEKFVRAHERSLRSLHLEDAWILVEEIHDWGVSLRSATDKTIVHKLAEVQKLGILEELTINSSKAEA